jgi:hypothetical protein
MTNGSFNVGDVSGVGHAIGHGAQSNVQIGAEQANELKQLLGELRQRLSEAPVPEATKQVMLTRALPELEKAIAAPDPQQAVKSGLERISENLEIAGAAGEKVVKIAEVVKKIAGIVGLGIGAAAPFLARFF